MGRGMADLNQGWSSLSYCVIDNVFCSSCSDWFGFRWYDTRRQSWESVKGVRRLTEFAGHGIVKMADYGGKLAVFWTGSFRDREKTIWRAVIALERRNGDGEDEEMWGTVECVDPLLTIPTSYDFVRAFAATV
ncbi:unnamed protein product [Microthlaspi erraticum]|uniref:FKB95-like N-terminal Kelch domain-containing protein n=1 Tax=Microthlaspi erraticum TaxID=1685480 RepID=A0A6D2KSB8_9BRAS|nr:unnamed protein product [Microthlaspi erraticum]